MYHLTPELKTHLRLTICHSKQVVESPFWPQNPLSHLKADKNCKTQPPASIGWVALSSVVRRRRCPSVPHCNISSYLHYVMFQTIQIIYFLWGYDPGNMSLSFIAELSPVYCCLVHPIPAICSTTYGDTSVLKMPFFLSPSMRDAWCALCDKALGAEFSWFRS